MKTIKKTSLRQHHWTRLFFVCLSLLSFCHSATAEVVSDTCIVKYKGDSLLVITDTLKGSNVEIDYHVSYVNRPIKNYSRKKNSLMNSQKREIMKITKNVGFLLLGVWLVITGLLNVVELPIPSIDILLSILAIASGAMIILGKQN